MGKKKQKLQTLVFNRDIFDSRAKVKSYIKKNDFKIDNRLRKPIMLSGDEYRVRQRNPVWFKKSTLKSRKLGKGIKGIYGIIK